MEQVSLSNIELYYTSMLVENNKLFISGDECHHIKDVMRHNPGDEIFVTNGTGSIYKVKIDQLDKKMISSTIIENFHYPNKLKKIHFCIPRLKNTDRFEFALEKCVELGITNFIVFESERTIAKGEKIERWKKVLLSAMKQSLQAWLPKINYSKSFKELMKFNGKKILFDQHSEISLNDLLNTKYSMLNSECYFIFGPEGGLTEEELQVTNDKSESDLIHVRLTNNRLRAETAIVTAASVISLNLNSFEER